MVRTLTAYGAFFAAIVWGRLSPNEWSHAAIWITFVGLLFHFVFSPSR